MLKDNLKNVSNIFNWLRHKFWRFVKCFRQKVGDFYSRRMVNKNLKFREIVREEENKFD